MARLRTCLGLILAVLVLLGPGAPRAQTQDNGMIVGYLEDLLSSEGRVVQFSGITGLLSSQATIGAITIADTDGIWLRISDARIDWTRRDLLSGIVTVNALSAASIEIIRPPVASGSTISPEATPLALPELPVSVDLRQVRVSRLSLGAPVLGVAAELSGEASFRLDESGLFARLIATRTGGEGGALRVRADLTRGAGTLDLDVDYNEPAGGLLARALGLPGTPPLALKIAGAGPLDDMNVALSLSADQAEVVAGDVRLFRGPDGYSADLTLGGAIAALLPDYAQPFFAGDSQLQAQVLRRTDGGISVPEFRLETGGAMLRGHLTTAANGYPETLGLTGRLGRPVAEELVLPFGGGRFALSLASLDLDYDRNADNTWTASIAARQVRLDDARVARLDITGGGVFDDTAGLAAIFTGDTALKIDGVSAPSDHVLAALAPQATGHLAWHWTAGAPLVLDNLRLSSDRLNLVAGGGIGGPVFTGNVSLRSDDLRWLDAFFASASPAGAAEGQFDGWADLWSGQFDGLITLQGQDLAIGQDRIDGLLRGAATLSAEARRNEAGITLRKLGLNTPHISGTASGRLATDRREAQLDLAFPDLAQLTPALSGAGGLTASLSGSPEATSLDLAFQSDAGPGVTLAGMLGEANNLAGTAIALPLALVNEVLPDTALRGRLDGAFTVTGDLGQPAIGFDADIKGFGMALLEGYGLGTSDISAKGGWQGGRVTFERYAITDSSGLSASGKGWVDPGSQQMGLAAAGQLPLSLVPRALGQTDILAGGVARFDLAILGPLDLPILDGTATVSDATLGLSTWNTSLGDVTAVLEFQGRSVRVVTVSAQARAGGSIRASGSVGLTPDLPLDMAIEMSGFRYSDNALISTELDGNLSLGGTLATGAVLSGVLSPRSVDITLNPVVAEATGLADISHRNAPAAVTATLAKAGLLQSGGATGEIGLNLQLSAPRRIFVRGRGLDAELGGDLLLTGSTSDVVASGGFRLIRGRLDFLGKRLNLTEGTLTFAGSLDPRIDFAAQAQSDGLEARVRLSGSADAPEITLSSTPDLPEDEILARLIFSRDIANLSVLQITRLASAMAELAGRSDAGIVERLRRAAGVDNLDLKTGDDGTTSGVLGKYLQENIYSEVEVDTGGKAKVSINLDLGPEVTVRGSVDTENSGGIGVFFERDY
ncbi:MAG: translocation/assembly module TamB domain-containing protein [Rhodobacteraceae bacterium]|nr:translocation/assembly module TamB domain-containing protein [Paracoccaceae bacterium]